MRARFGSWRLLLREGLWFIPTITTLTAVLLALGLVRLDRTVRFDERADLPWWLFGGGAEGTRAVLEAIAGTTITVTGVVFSITVVALQLASSQFSPLVLRTFRADRGNQIVLGVLIATFTYALIVLRSVVSPGPDAGFVPVIATSGAIGLALLSVALLIFFIHHAARSVQASTIIDRASNDTLALIHHLYPEDIGDPEDATRVPQLPASPAAVVLSTRAGYLQAVDGDTLFDLSEDQTLTVRVERLPGDFILPGSALASVWPKTSVDEDLEDKVRSAFLIGNERTLQSDVELGIRQIADIAIKALSPGIKTRQRPCSVLTISAPRWFTLVDGTVPGRCGQEGMEMSASPSSAPRLTNWWMLHSPRFGSMAPEMPSLGPTLRSPWVESQHWCRPSSESISPITDAWWWKVPAPSSRFGVTWSESSGQPHGHRKATSRTPIWRRTHVTFGHPGRPFLLGRTRADRSAPESKPELS